jgi:UDP-N-acetylmuramate dehydrogenase
VIRPEAKADLIEVFGDRARFDAPMSRHTSLRIGGPADALVIPETVSEIEELLRLCARHEMPHCVLGNGFNTLVLDCGIEGVVLLLNKLRGVEPEGPSKLRVQAGVSHASLMNYCVQNGLSGLEFGAGIPGTIGGWIAMNAGIGSREVKDVVLGVEVVTPPEGVRNCFRREELDFSYRALRGLTAGSVIISGLFSVSPAESPAVKKEVQRMLSLRSGSQPLDVPSCGSVFKNPEADFAGRLIEAAGLKGSRAGGAQISDVHANFIVNTGGAQASDVRELIERARECVFESEGIQLETEVRILGRESA